MKKIYGCYTPKEYAEKLFKAIGKEGVYKIKEGDEDDEEEAILSFDEWVDIFPKTIKVATIAGDKEEDGFEVGKVVHYSNYPFEPDEYDYQPVSEHSHIAHAIQAAASLLLENDLQNAIEFLSEDAFSKAEEMEEV